MKILIVHEVFGALAGAEQNILVSGAALKQKGEELFLLYSTNSHSKEKQFDALFKDKFQIDFDHQDNLDKTQKIQDVLNEVQPDLIYVHKLTDLCILNELFKQKLPMVRMVHDHDTYCLRGYRYNYFTRKPCRRKAGLVCYFPCLAFTTRNPTGKFPLKINSLSQKLKEIDLNKQFDKVFVVTNYMKEEFMIQGFAQEKINIFPPVPNSQTESFESNFSDKNIILYLGQIIRGKGVDCLIRSLHKVKNPFTALIIGKGSYTSYCQKLTKKLGLEDKVHFKGWIEQEELKRFYQEASIVTVPSVWPEPIATIGLEVMRYGLPVVGFNSGGISDWLKDGQTGFLLDWMDIDGFAQSIDKLLEDKNLAKQMGERGRNLVNDQYDFSEYIQRMRETFHQLVV